MVGVVCNLLIIMSTVPLVTIRCITYNHEPFIRRCLDGFVMQKTNFPFEAVVHDDASTDGTADIIREYAEKYPHIIKPIYEKENLWSKRDGSLQRVMDAAMRGKYVAMCEGDDYWIDPNKLQTQVDFMEAHPEYSMCFHAVRVEYENKELEDSIYPPPEWLKKDTLGLDDFKERNWAQTNSVLYRWRFVPGSPQWFDLVPLGSMPGDYMMNLLHAQLGKAHYDPTVRAVYHRHEGGVWWGGDKDEFYQRWGYAHMLFFRTCTRLFGEGFEKETLYMACRTVLAYLRGGKIDALARYRDAFPEVYETALKELRIPLLEPPPPPPTRQEQQIALFTQTALAHRWVFRFYRWIYKLSRLFIRHDHSQGDVSSVDKE